MHASRSERVDASAAVNAESIPPETPSTTSREAVLLDVVAEPEHERPAHLLELGLERDDGGRVGRAACGCGVELDAPRPPASRRDRGPSARRRTSRSRRAMASVGSMSTRSSASSKPGARATTSPASSSTTECPSKISSSWPPTRLQKARKQALSRARVTSISSRSSALPTWNGDAERLTRSCAPASARSVAGGPGSQTSSQIVGPTRTSPKRSSEQVAARREVAVLVEDAVVGEVALAVDTARRHRRRARRSSCGGRPRRAGRRRAR